MEEIIIFTDGSSRGNPGPGGWGSVIVAGDHVRELGGREDDTTNNKMELAAALAALKSTDEGSVIKLHTDSSYVINGITKWVNGWKRNGWQTTTKTDVSNRDLWEELDMLNKERSVSWIYVGGHVGIAGNERCDEIATSFADNAPTQLFDGKLAQYSIKNILDISYNSESMESKKSSSSRSKAKAFSYVSAIGGDVKVHSTWAECEARVKGKKGVRYKKALDKREEESLVKEFGS